MKIEFNTGRLYTAQGQPMRAIFRPNGLNEVWFQDNGRGITARMEINSAMPEPSSKHGFQEFVMHNYDHMNYSAAHLSDYAFNQVWDGEAN